MYRRLFQRILLGVGQVRGEEILQTLMRIEGMHNLEMGQTGRCDGGGQVDVFAHAAPIPRGEVAANESHREETWHDGNENARDHWDFYKRHDVRRNKVRQGRHIDAHFLGRSRLYRLDITDQPGDDLT